MKSSDWWFMFWLLVLFFVDETTMSQRGFWFAVAMHVLNRVDKEFERLDKAA